MDYIAAAADMREKAWSDLVSSHAFRAFRAADNMVVELGGASVMPNMTLTSAPDKTPIADGTPAARKIRVRAKDGSLKPKQADAAYRVLTELGPMNTKNVMELAVAMGATAGGSNPLSNFRSAISHDDRFYSFRHNGEHLWWLEGVDLPKGWDEATGDLLRDAASSDADQKGGDGHDPATT